MAPATPGAPDGRVQGDSAAPMARGAPAWVIAGNEAQLDGGAATAWAKHGCGPGLRALADEIEPGMFEDTGEIVDEFSRKARP